MIAPDAQALVAALRPPARVYVEPYGPTPGRGPPARHLTAGHPAGHLTDGRAPHSFCHC